MRGSDDRIDPIYFDYKISEMTIFFYFLGSPGYVRLLRAARDRFYDKKRFLTKKVGKSGNLEWTTIPRILSETTAPCYLE